MLGKANLCHQHFSMTMLKKLIKTVLEKATGIVVETKALKYVNDEAVLTQSEES